MWDRCAQNMQVLSRELDVRIKLALGNATFSDRIGAFKEIVYLQFLPKFHWVHGVFGFAARWQLWSYFTIIVSLLTLFKSNNPVMDVFVLAVAHLSNWRMGIVPALPYMTAVSLWVAIVSMGTYVFDPYLSMTIAWAQLPLTLVLTSYMCDETFVIHLKGSLVLSCTATLIHTSIVLTGSSTYAFLMILTFRALRLLVATVGNRIEIKDINGKVIGVVPTGPKQRVWNFVQRLKQLRSSTTGFTVIKPDAICTVHTSDGMGTGFICGNDIVTAGHVVGNNRMVEIHYQGLVYQARVRYRPDKDVAFLAIPGDMKVSARYKLAPNPNYDNITVTAYTEQGLVVSTAKGMCHGDTISYAITTQNGMSGAPVTDQAGRVLGVHQTHTGYTGGAVVLRLEDLTPPPKERNLEAEIEELKKQLAAKEALTKPMDQCTQEGDVVAMIREAMAREMMVLRQELNREFGFEQKKKGKNKAGGRGHVRKHVGKTKGRKYLTEEEYRALLEKGLDREDLLDLIDDIIDKRIGFPVWSDPETDDDDDPYGRDNDVEYDPRDWSHQSKVHEAQLVVQPKVKASEIKPVVVCAADCVVEEVIGKPTVTKPEIKENKEFCQRWGKEPQLSDYEFDWTEDDAKNILPDNTRLTKVDSIVLGAKITKLRTILNSAISSGNYSALPHAVHELDWFAWDNGLEGFLQRVKSKKPKNGKGGPKKNGAPKNGN